MFNIPIHGEVNGKNIDIFLGRRYKIETDSGDFGGTITKCENDSFLIKTVDGGFFIDFDLINNIEEI